MLRQLSHMHDVEAEPSRPSESELRLLRPLWSAPRLSARELHEATCGITGWGYSATRKTLDRMVGKGLIRIEVVHGLNTYAATQSKLVTLARVIRNFASNVLDSDVLPMAAFAHSKLIDRAEIEELERLLRDLGSEDRSEREGSQ
jgi:predicted transcriptional regulator